MSNIIVYKDERDAGLVEALNHNCLTIAARLESLTTEDEKKLFNLVVSDSAIATAKTKNEGLHPLKTLLVSTGWNNNTDVFAREEVWAARHTPEDKPFNLEHNQNNIIGHITSNICVDNNHDIIADDSVIDDLPDLYHIITGSVLYTVWADKEREKAIAKIIEEIKNGDWFVSMECWFSGFDYMLRSQASEELLKRDHSTAFLTKHLRAYGGKGEYEGREVGRVMRNIVFSGKGLVRRPANPASIIFTEARQTTTTKQLTPETIPTRDLEMATTTANTNENAAVRIAELERDLAQAKSVQDELTAAKEKLAGAEKTISEVTIAKLTLEKENTTLKSDLSKANTELTSLRKEVTKASRVSALVKAGLSEQDAETKVVELVNVDDNSFKVIVDTIASIRRPDMEDNADLGDNGNANDNGGGPPPKGDNGPRGKQTPKLKPKAVPAIKGASEKAPYQDETTKAAKDAAKKAKKKMVDDEGDDDEDDQADANLDIDEKDENDAENDLSLAADNSGEDDERMHAMASFILDELHPGLKLN